MKLLSLSQYRSKTWAIFCLLALLILLTRVCKALTSIILCSLFLKLRTILKNKLQKESPILWIISQIRIICLTCKDFRWLILHSFYQVKALSITLKLNDRDKSKDRCKPSQLPFVRIILSRNLLPRYKNSKIINIVNVFVKEEKVMKIQPVLNVQNVNILIILVALG